MPFFGSLPADAGVRHILQLKYSCEQASRLASLAMERPLARTERLLLGLHLMMCGRCSSFARQIAFLRRAARRLPEALERDED